MMPKEFPWCPPTKLPWRNTLSPLISCWIEGLEKLGGTGTNEKACADIRMEKLYYEYLVYTATRNLLPLYRMN